MAKVTRLPTGTKEMGGKVYDIVTPCCKCGHFKLGPTDDVGHCVYEMYGFDSKRIVICGDKCTDKQKR